MTESCAISSIWLRWVLDEVNLKFLTRQQVIALFDPDEDATFDVRFKSFSLTAKVKKILISNEPPSELYPPDPYGAISRRFLQYHVTVPTFAPLMPTPAPARAPLAPITFPHLSPATLPGPHAA